MLGSDLNFLEKRTNPTACRKIELLLAQPGDWYHVSGKKGTPLNMNNLLNDQFCGGAGRAPAHKRYLAPTGDLGAASSLCSERVGESPTSKLVQ